MSNSPNFYIKPINYYNLKEGYNIYNILSNTFYSIITSMGAFKALYIKAI